MGENNDVHIVLAAGSDAAAARAAWERWNVDRLLAQQQRHEGDLAARDRLEAAAWEVRVKCSERLALQLEHLEPYIDGTMGEVSASMAAAYTKAVVALGQLWGVTRGGRPVTPAPVLPEPERVADEAVVEVERVAAAVEARAVVAGQLERVLGDMRRVRGELGS